MLTFEMKSCVFQTTIQYVTSVPASASAFLSSSFPQKQTHVQTTTMKAFKYEIIVASFRALVSQFPGKKMKQEMSHSDITVHFTYQEGEKYQVSCASCHKGILLRYMD